MIEPAETIAVPLAEKTVTALNVLVARTGLSRADLINQAVQLLDLYDLETRAGSQLLLRHSDGSTYQLHQL